MIATRGYRPPACFGIRLCPVLVPVFLAAVSSAQAKCTEKIVSEFATATSRDTAERNATAKLAQKLKKRGIEERQLSGKPTVACRKPLMWQCIAEVKVCL